MAKKRASHSSAIQRAPVNQPALSSSEELPPFISRQNQPVDRGSVRIIEEPEMGMSLSVTRHHHKGPLPDPETLRKYDDIIPNGAERIMAMAEREQKQRHGMGRIREGRALLGVIFAFLLGLSGFGAAAYALFLGQAAASCVVFISTIGAITGTFIYGTATSDKPQLPEAKTESPPDAENKAD